MHMNEENNYKMQDDSDDEYIQVHSSFVLFKA